MKDCVGAEVSCQEKPLEAGLIERVSGGSRRVSRGVFLNGGQLLEVSEIGFLKSCQVLKPKTFWLLGQVR